jgi:5-methylcytosine-specific restriction endonuclease McrA
MARDPEKKRAARRLEYRKHRDRYLQYAASYRAANDERLREWFRAYRSTRREYYRERSSEWVRLNPGRQRALLIARANRLHRQTPSWVNYDDLNRVYLDCPKGMVVDHIVPLKGRTIEGWHVVGLHVPWNLQYLPPSDNNRKKNRMTVADHQLCGVPAIHSQSDFRQLAHELADDFGSDVSLALDEMALIFYGSAFNWRYRPSIQLSLPL